MINTDEYIYCLEVDFGDHKGYFNGAHYIIVANPYNGNRYKTVESMQADMDYVKGNFSEDIKISPVDFKTACKEYNAVYES